VHNNTCEAHEVGDVSAEAEEVDPVRQIHRRNLPP
jgi:hypothetical protein